MSAVRGDALATLFYVANWHFILSDQGYFVQAAAPSPLLHTWSLAVEEQYYLIWPLVVLAVARRWGVRAAGRRRRGRGAGLGRADGLPLPGRILDRPALLRHRHPGPGPAGRVLPRRRRFPPRRRFHHRASPMERQPSPPGAVDRPRGGRCPLSGLGLARPVRTGPLPLPGGILPGGPGRRRRHRGLRHRPGIGDRPPALAPGPGPRGAHLLRPVPLPLAPVPGPRPRPYRAGRDRAAGGPAGGHLRRRPLLVPVRRGADPDGGSGGGARKPWAWRREPPPSWSWPWWWPR